jgi:hypothetical protein
VLDVGALVRVHSCLATSRHCHRPRLGVAGFEAIREDETLNDGDGEVARI